MAELKTKKTEQSVEAFLDNIADEQTRKDCYTILNLMQEATQSRPKMWGPAIVGFGDYHYKYASGREGDWFLTGFSPRKQNLSLYIMSGFGEYDKLLKQLGKYKTGVSCLYVKRLADVNVSVLKKMIEASVRKLTK
jgi:hypothetical protein